MYLFGTIHVPYTKLWDGIPGNAKVAFSSCDEVCLELVLSDQTTREELAKCQKLPGRYNSIEELLSEEMVDRIERYFESVKRVFPQWLNEGSSLLGGSDRLVSSLLSCFLLSCADYFLFAHFLLCLEHSKCACKQRLQCL